MIYSINNLKLITEPRKYNHQNQTSLPKYLNACFYYLFFFTHSVVYNKSCSLCWQVLKKKASQRATFNVQMERITLTLARFQGVKLAVTASQRAE